MTNLEFFAVFAAIWLAAGLLSTIGTAHWFLLRHAINDGDKRRVMRNLKRIIDHVIFWIWRG